MFNILRTINSLRLPEKVLFGRKSRCNQLYSLLNVFVCLLIGPCFMIRNPCNYAGSPLSCLMSCKKDVFYDFLRDVRINWRKLMYHINVQLWTRIEVRSDHKERTTCLMVDDTDFPKTGKRMERIGRVHSHLEHRSILGFKALFLGITDGVSQMLLDFALVGEEGSKKNYGMSQEELDAKYASERDKDDAVGDRLAEYDKDKITLAMDMVRTPSRGASASSTCLPTAGSPARKSSVSSTPATSNAIISDASRSARKERPSTVLEGRTSRHPPSSSTLTRKRQKSSAGNCGAGTSRRTSPSPASAAGCSSCGAPSTAHGAAHHHEHQA